MQVSHINTTTRGIPRHNALPLNSYNKLLSDIFNTFVGKKYYTKISYKHILVCDKIR